MSKNRKRKKTTHQKSTEVLVGRVPVPKTRQMTPSPRGDATEMVVGGGAVPKTGQSPAEDLSKSRQLTRTGAFQARHCR